MTAMLDRLPSSAAKRNNEALGTIAAYRDQAGEQFELSDLEREFPYFVQRLGRDGLYLADAAANYAGTFKWRGALNKMHELREAGSESVTVPSAGNHLRGAIVAGRVLNMIVHGVVPRTAPMQKKEGARQLQPDATKFQLHVVGDLFDESLAWALEHPELGDLVHPFDDPAVADGQGTIADDVINEAQRQGIDVRHIVVPVGGGGLLRGIAERLISLDPTITVHGIEAEGSDSLSRSREADTIVPATHPNKKYGGSAVLRTGRGTLGAVQTLPNVRLWPASDADVLRVAEDYEESMRYRELHRFPNFTPFEPTTLVALAGMRRVAQEYPDEGIVVVGTGRNDSLDAVWS